jgi:3-hydroxyisobutyrate dehydrogenase
MKPGSFYIDHTTASADIAREIYNVSNKNNISFYDAPVSGGQAGAENGALTIMVGGDEKNFKSVNLLISNYAKRVCLMGKTGSGQLAKMANQIAIAGIIQGLSEALSFSKNAGLEVKTLIEAISQGAAQSWQMDNRWETLINGEFNFGFAVEWMRKDLKICFEEASRNGSELPLANLIDKYYQEIEEMGGERWDTSSLIARLNLDTSQSDE